MVTMSSNGFAELVIPPSSGISRQQDAPEILDMTTVAYVTDPEFVMTQKSIFQAA